jgi:hypothetical protein
VCRNRDVYLRGILNKLDENSVPRGPDFGRREAIETTPLIEEKDVFSRLKDPDSKVSSKAAEYLINNYEENRSDIPKHLDTIIKSQAALFSSNNENVKSRAEELISKCVANELASLLVKPICN